MLCAKHEHRVNTTARSIHPTRRPRPGRRSANSRGFQASRAGLREEHPIGDVTLFHQSPVKPFVSKLTQLRWSRLSTAPLRGSDECGWPGLSGSCGATKRFLTAEKSEMKRCKPPTDRIPASSVLVFEVARENSPRDCSGPYAINVRQRASHPVLQLRMSAVCR